MKAAPQSDGAEDTIELQQIVARLWEGRRWIIASVIVCTALLATLAFVMKPVYRSSAVLVPAQNYDASLGGAFSSVLGSLGGIGALAGLDLMGKNGDVEEALAVLRSRQFTESFIVDKNLMPLLFARRWDAEQKRWKNSRKPPTLAQGYKYFDKKVRSIIRDKKTGLIVLQIDWKDRELAAQWANELVERLNAEMRSRAFTKADASIRFLEEEFKRTALVGTRDAISRLVEVQINKRMLANVTREYALRIVDRALPADRDDPVKPKKLLLIAAGAFAGLLLGMLVVLSRGWFAALAPGRGVTRTVQESA